MADFQYLERMKMYIYLFLFQPKTSPTPGCNRWARPNLKYRMDCNKVTISIQPNYRYIV